MRDQAADVRPPAERHLARCLFSLRRISRRQSYTGLHATVYGVIELTEIDSDLDLVLVGDIFLDDQLLPTTHKYFLYLERSN